MTPYIKTTTLGCIFFLSLFATLCAESVSLPPGPHPIPITTAVYIADVDSIDTAGQGFEARIFYELRWNDSRLRHEATGFITKKLSEVWNPGVQILNQQKAWSASPDMVRIYPNGDVVYLKTVWGSFSQPLDLRNFPFDTQTFTLQIIAMGGFKTDSITFLSDTSGRAGIADALSVADWKVMSWESSNNPYVLKNGMSSPMMSYAFTAERMTSYFIIKMIIPLIMIVMMSWAVFWMDPLNVASNVSISITSMLTLIAYRFSADALLPRLSYLTCLDYFILASSVLVFFSLVQNLTTASLAKNGSIEKATRLDIICRMGFPVLFIGIILETLVFRFMI